VDFEFSHVVDGAHSIVDLVLPLLAQRTVNCFVVDATTTIILIDVRIVQLLIQNSTKGLSRVEFDPGWRQHEVDMPFEFVTPELDDPAQVELADDVVRLDQSIHVCFQSMVSINALLVKLDLDEAIWVRSDDKVDFSPVYHDHLLDIIYNIWQLSRC